MLKLSYHCPLKSSTMDLANDGFHCNSCNKNIHDFRNKKQSEIAKTIQDNEEQTCGVFLTHQLHESTYLTFQRFIRSVIVAIFIFGLNATELFAQNSTDTSYTNTVDAEQRTIQIKGNFSDEKTGEPIIFARVIITYGINMFYTVTDFEGNYSITIPLQSASSEMTLQVIALEYEPIKIEHIKVDPNTHSIVVSDQLQQVDFELVGIVIYFSPSLIPSDPYDFNRTTFSNEDLKNY